MKTRISRPWFALFVVALSLPAVPAAAEGDDRYLVEFQEFGPRAAAAVGQSGGKVARELPGHGVIAAWLSQGARDRLLRDPNVRSIEMDPKRYPMAQTVPYGITMVQADQVSDASANNRKVCIIDSGFSLQHEDLQDLNVTGTNDPGTGNWDEDFLGHGSHVAGTIAALSNALGVVGVLSSGVINLHIVKVFNSDGLWTYTSDLINALDVCRDAGSNVVNMSLGGQFKSRLEERAFNQAYQAGVLSVAAAGNGGNKSVLYPAGYKSVISVAAIDSLKNVASFSQANRDVELAAPGVGVLSTVGFLETNTLSSAGDTWSGNWIENAARTSVLGVSQVLIDGDLCDSTNPAWSDKVVICERGSITFNDKVQNVESSGGVAAVIYNNVPGNFFGTLGAGNSSGIPAISLSQADGVSALSNVGLQGTVVSNLQEPSSGYEAWDGTSMATPHVAGVAALVWSHNPSWTNVQIRNALNKTAEDLGASGRDIYYGYGLVQAKAALDDLLAP